MSENAKEMFLQRRQDDYERQMKEHWDSLRNSSELVRRHWEIKGPIVSKVRDAWRKEMGTPQFPEDLRDKLSHLLDHTLDSLKIHFRSKQEFSHDEEYSQNSRLPNKHSENVYFGSSNAPVSSSYKLPTTTHVATTTDHSPEDEYALGIDLGTTMCCVAVMYKGKVQIVQNRSQGNLNTTPSYVHFKDDGEGTFGYVAKNQAYRFPENTIYDAKRMIGRHWNDPNLQADLKLWGFQVVEENGNPKIKIGSRTRFPHEISARLLSQLRAMAEESLHVKRGSIKKVVITVPAYFSEPQRKATKDAATGAGLQVLNILSEPTAAALAYKHEKKLEGTRKALIYDLGGGTFDVSIAVVKSDNVDILCVKGDTHLGGQDFDQLLMEYCWQKFKQETGLDILADKQSEDKRKRDQCLRALGRLRKQCEDVKEKLSSTKSYMLDIDGLYDGHDLAIEVTREALDNLCRPLIQRTFDIVEQALEDANDKGISSKEQIDDIILVGGSTRMPLVIDMVKEFFEGRELCTHINPDEAVAIGAAIQSFTLKTGNVNNNNNNEMDCGVQDVTPLTLGIECEDDTFSKVIPRNTKIPCDFHQTYCTSYDYQTQMHFTVCQGESKKASENITLGEFIFNGIPLSKAEQERIRVKMTIDAMGILQVKAVSETTGKEDNITISSNQLGMKESEIMELAKELENLQN